MCTQIEFVVTTEMSICPSLKPCSYVETRFKRCTSDFRHLKSAISAVYNIFTYVYDILHT